MTLLRDQLKPLKQHYHILRLSVIPVERGSDRKPKIKPLPKEKAEDKMTQTQGKDKSN